MSSTAPKADVAIGPNQNDGRRFGLVKLVDLTVRIEQNAEETRLFTANHDRGIDKVSEIAFHLNKQGIQFQSSIGVCTGKKQKVMNWLPQQIKQSNWILTDFLLEFAIRCTVTGLKGVTRFPRYNRAPAVVNPDLRHGFSDPILNQVDTRKDRK